MLLVDIDAACDNQDVYSWHKEHIEQAGIHSGDSACSLPPHSLSTEIIEQLREQTRKLALGLNVIGLMNVQFAIQGKNIFVLEVNPRASRTIFVAKATGVPVAKIAAKIATGLKLKDLKLSDNEPTNTYKRSCLPFSRFPGVDIILGPEMKSTGEVMGIDRDFASAFAKSQLGAGTVLPKNGTVFLL